MNIKGWYPVSPLGWVATVLYATSFSPLYYFPEDFTSQDRLIAIFFTFVVLVAMFVAKKKKYKPFLHKKGVSGDSGFSLIELLIVISIIGILASIILPAFGTVRQKAYFAIAKKELRSIEDSLFLYLEDHNEIYPADTNRDIPPGLEDYLAPGLWPDAAWPGSVFDWDNWSANNLSYEPKEQVYQISIRFCPIGEPDECQFPDFDWAENFDINSAVYYCLQGPCRSHPSKPVDHPGYCVNCIEE